MICKKCEKVRPKIVWEMNIERIAKRVYESEVEGRWGRGRPNSVWIDGVRKALKLF